jgi:DNA-binding transcriptional LysR family regulator
MAVAPVDDIETFVAVARNASFTRAAEQLGASKSNVGKAVQRLEARLGVKLFQRTTRAVRLTEEGETYLDAARSALDSLAEAETILASRHKEPAGRVRIDAPVGFGRILLPTFATLRERFPKVTLELSLSDKQSDAVGDGWDIVVRIGALPDTGEMTVRKLCDLRLALYASPAYIARRGPIDTIDDLWAQDAVLFRAGSGRVRPWTLPQTGAAARMSLKSSLVVSDGRALVDAAITGLGIAQIFDRVAQPHVFAGELNHVLPEVDVAGPPVHALIPFGRRMPAKTRAVLDHLVEVLGAPARAIEKRS